MSSGRIVQIIGAVIDVEFPRDQVPNVYEALKVQGAETTLEVQQQLGDGVVRTIAMGSTEGLKRGLDVNSTGKAISVPVGKATLGRIMDVLGNPIDEAGPIGEEEQWEIHRPAPSYAEQAGSNELLETGIKVIDFSEVPADVLPVVTGTLARLLYDVQFWMNGRTRTPVTLLCDEAHLYLPVRDDADAVQRQALGSFERIAKEGRKYGFSLLVVSQRPSDVSRTILSQCNNFLALRLTNETDQGVIKRLMPDSLAGLTSILPLLDTGEALLLGDAVLLPTRIKLDMPKVAPDSATRDFWKEWGSAKPDNATIAAAIECLRGQSRSG